MTGRVSDVMHHGVITCDEKTPLHDVARRMTDNDISALVVVDQQGALVGIISRTDLVKARVYEQYWRAWRNLTAGHIMTRDVVTVHASESIEAAGRLLMERHIHRLVVVEEREGRLYPVGVLSISDIVRNLAQS